MSKRKGGNLYRRGIELAPKRADAARRSCADYRVVK